MRSPGEIWRQRLWIWVPALLFFLANAGAFAVYTLGYAGRIDSLQERLDQQAAELKDAARKRQQMEMMISRVQTNEQQVEQLYASRLSTRSDRLTRVTDEFKQLAKESGLVPKSITYAEDEIQEYGLIKRSFTFSVQGTYASLRKFVTRLETSHSFLSIDEVTVANETTGPELRIDLTVSTLFTRDTQDPLIAAPASASSSSSSSSRTTTSTTRTTSVKPGGRP